MIMIVKSWRFAATAVITSLICSEVHAQNKSELGGNGSARRCYAKTEPADLAEYTRTAREFVMFKESMSTGEESRRIPGSISVNVYSHVIMSKTENTDIAEEFLDKQIKVLNDAFGGVVSHTCGERSDTDTVNTSFRFLNAGVTHTVNSEWYTAAPGSSEEFSMKKALHIGSCADLNMYFINVPGNLLGWSSFPWDCTSNPWDSGVVTVARTGISGNVNEKESATHQIGHWLGLWHTFQGPDGGRGDEVDDTPVDMLVMNGCRTDTNDFVNNIMDYTKDCCIHQFTQGQSDRMEFMWKKYRKENVPSTPPTKKPTSSPVVECVQFLLDLKLDFYVVETDWVLKRGNEVVKRSVPYTQEYQAFQEELCLPDDCYSFQIRDENGDGLTYGHGGSYTLYWDGQNIKVGGDFQYEETTYIACPPPKAEPTAYPPTIQPSSSPTSSYCLQFILNLEIDSYGKETSWFIKKGDEVIKNVAFVYNNNGKYQENLCLPADCYSFTIEDAFGDGLGGGEGSYSAYFDGELIKTGGDFRYSEKVNFGCLSSDLIPFVLNLTLGKFGYETSWIIKKDKLVIEKGSDYRLSNHREDLFLLEGCYSFTINSVYGDGLRNSEYEDIQGNYSIYWDGELIKTGGDFGYSETTYFGCSTPNIRSNGVDVVHNNICLALLAFFLSIFIMSFIILLIFE